MTVLAPYQNPALATRKVRFSRVLAAEWIKLRSLRSTWWVFGVYLVLAVGFQLILVFNFYWPAVSEVTGGEEAWRNLVSEQMVEGQATVAFAMVVMVLAVAGVLLLTNEYSSGMIRSTFAAVPRRLPVLLAKALLISLVTIALMAIAELFGAAVAGLVAQTKDVTLTVTATVWRIWGMSLVTGALLVLLFLGLGALLRSSAAGIATAYGLSMVIPSMILPLLGLVNEVFVKAIKYFPMAAGTSTINASPFVEGDTALGLLPSFLVMLAWAAVAMILGGWRFMRRDA